MANLTERLLSHGIRLPRHVPGGYKITCPKCSANRRNKSDPCLSITIEAQDAVWHCHNCGWSDWVTAREEARMKPQSRPKASPNKPDRSLDAITPEALAWFAKRGISEATVRRNGIGVRRTYIPARKGEVDCLAFPYLRGGEIVNIKFRTLEGKEFAQVKGAEKILLGLDDIAHAKAIIIVEGELDKLALEEAGFQNCVSVPDGAPRFVKNDPSPEDAKFSYLTNCADQLGGVERIILAVDNDEPGQTLKEELARRLGRERCLRVRWPDMNDAPCKDANETLLAHGAKVLAECIAAAEPYPISGLHNVREYEAETLDLFRDGRKRGHSTGWSSIDEFMTIREGELSIVTGVPNSGKSEFIDALMVNLAARYGWRFGLCSFENPPSEHIAKLAEKHAAQPFWDGPTARMSEPDLRRAMDWVNDHFAFIRADDEAPTIDWILEAARGAVLRYGIKGLVIDPYNEIESKRPSNQTETEYVSQLLGKVKRFAQLNGVHVWFVAHPAKMLRDSAGNIPVPTLYDISGSANWANKADIGIVVHRDANRDQTKTDVYIRKVRFKSVGKIGAASLRYDRATGRYAELATSTSASWVERG